MKMTKATLQSIVVRTSKIQQDASKNGKKKYQKFSDSSAAIQKKKGISKDRANAYVASVERKQGIEPRTGKKKKTTMRKTKKQF